MRSRILLASLLSLVGASAAADVAGPISGYLFDGSAKAIRPVLGIPGASLIGDPLELGFEIALAAVAPAQDLVVAVTADGGVRLIRPGTRTAAAMETLHGTPARVVLSPGGSAALFVNSDTADVYTGMASAPALARTLALGSLGEVSAWAVSDDGTAVLAVAGGTVRLAGEVAEWKILAEAGAGARIAFAPARRDALVATASGVSLYRDVTGGGEISIFASPEEGSPAPEAAAFAADGRILLAAGRAVTALDPADSSRASIPCDCTPSGLSPMGPVFRLTELSDAPLWLLDPKRDEPRTVFVPAPQSRQAIVLETP